MNVKTKSAKLTSQSTTFGRLRVYIARSVKVRLSKYDQGHLRNHGGDLDHGVSRLLISRVHGSEPKGCKLKRVELNAERRLDGDLSDRQVQRREEPVSIYPVKLSEWYPFGDERHEIAASIVDVARCYSCGDRIRWNNAFGHHSLPYGHGDIWCSEKCSESGKKAKPDRRRERKFKRRYGA